MRKNMIVAENEQQQEQPQQTTAHPVDVHVGKKIRMRRQKLNWTLMDLARKLEISHQQIQKYEHGLTRVSASTLFELSRVLNTNQNYFFEGFEGVSAFEKNIHEHNTISLKPLRSLHVLLIEDDPSDQLLMRKAVDTLSQDVEMHCIQDAEKALEFLRHNKDPNDFPRPDIILLDLNLPRYSGLDFLRDIKKDRALMDIPIIVLTNSISRTEMNAVYKHSASGYICKSFDFDAFKNTVKDLLQYWMKTVVLPSRN